MRGTDEAPGPRGEIRSLTKGLAILKLFDPSHPEWTIEEVARKTGYPRPTAYRLVKTLELNDFLATGLDEKHYHLGPALAASHYLVANRLHLEKVLHQDLEVLAAATGETSNLMVDVGPMGGMHVDSVPGLAPIHLAPTLGYIDFCLAASSGKVLAAFRDDREIDFLLSTRLMRYTARTIVDPVAVRAELMTVRETGIAVDIQESSESISGVSAPIRNSTGEVVAVVSVVMVAERWPTGNTDALIGAVRKAGEKMSARLGYRAPK
jgi:IclR family transcriptional regulator, KDG regulon repressor